MRKYAYLIRRVNLKNPMLEAMLNNLGVIGWELIAIKHGNAIFKREMDEDEIELEEECVEDYGDGSVFIKDEEPNQTLD